MLFIEFRTPLDENETHTMDQYVLRDLSTGGGGAGGSFSPPQKKSFTEKKIYSYFK